VIFKRYLNTMSNLKTLKPFTKGDPRIRPKPKGIPNRSTVVRYVLGMKGQPPEHILKELETMYPVFFQKKGKKWMTELLMTIRLAQKAIVEGDVSAYNSLMNSAYGQPKSNVDITSGDEKISINIVDFKDKK